MLTMYFRNPMNGVKRVGTRREAWTIKKVDFPPLADGAPAPEPELVRSCHGAMRDGDGKQVPMDVLRTYDLREGLAAAFRAVDQIPQEVWTAPNGEEHLVGETAK